MTKTTDLAYPPDAYAPDGTLWWLVKRRFDRNQNLGAEIRISAWLVHNVEVGETFTMAEIRRALGNDALPNTDEHLNRRLRKLRSDGWSLLTHQDDGSIPIGVYKVDAAGWHPGLSSKRPISHGASQGIRRRILERDGSRCVICGVGDREEYAGEPGSKASLTVGHIVPSHHGGSGQDMNNLRTECKRCNEPVRHEIRPPEKLHEVLPDVRKLKRADKQRLLSWLVARQRTRDTLDTVYDRVRQLPEHERSSLEDTLRNMVKQQT